MVKILQTIATIFLSITLACPAVAGSLESARQFVVVISSKTEPKNSVSGLLIGYQDDKAYIATVAHAFTSEREVLIRFRKDPEITRLGYVLHINEEDDIAIVVLSNPPQEAPDWRILARPGDGLDRTAHIGFPKRNRQEKLNYRDGWADAYERNKPLEYYPVPQRYHIDDCDFCGPGHSGASFFTYDYFLLGMYLGGNSGDGQINGISLIRSEMESSGLEEAFLLRPRPPGKGLYLFDALLGISTIGSDYYSYQLLIGRNMDLEPIQFGWRLYPYLGVDGGIEWFENGHSYSGAFKAGLVFPYSRYEYRVYVATGMAFDSVDSLPEERKNQKNFRGRVGCEFDFYYRGPREKRFFISPECDLMRLSQFSVTGDKENSSILRGTVRVGISF